MSVKRIICSMHSEPIKRAVHVPPDRKAPWGWCTQCKAEQQKRRYWTKRLCVQPNVKLPPDMAYLKERLEAV